MARHSFFCIDGHTCGNPVRLVAGGGPLLRGATMMERRAHFLAEYDWIRTGLMFEPRGHDVMSGSILYPPTRDDCDIAILFIETSGCLPMCGHGTIGTVTMAHRARAGEAEDAGRAQARHAGRPGRRRIQAGRRICRGGAHHQRAVLPLCRRADGRMPGARRDHRRRRLWRQFLRDRRAAGELPRHGRPFGRRPDRLEPGRAPAAQREIQLRASGKSRHQPAVAHAVDRRAEASAKPMRATPSSMATRRSTARPAAPAPRRAWRSSTPRAG